VHDGLAIALAECLVEDVAVVPGEVIASERLSAVLVDALEDLVGSGVTETREEREESAGNRSIGSVSEDDLVQVRSRLDLATLLMRRLAVVSTGWKIMSSARPAHPAPKKRAVFDSLL